MTKTKFLILASLAFGLSACDTMSKNTSMYSVHQPVVERTNYTLDLDVSGGGIPAQETRRITEWLDALDLRYGDQVAIDYGDGYPDASVRQKVANIVADHGILLGNAPPLTPTPLPSGTIRVVVTRSSASVPTCPDWSGSTDANYNSGNHSNYGCATNSNLAAMVADPEDLVRGRKVEALDSNEGSKAINTQRSKRVGGN